MPQVAASPLHPMPGPKSCVKCPLLIFCVPRLSEGPEAAVEWPWPHSWEAAPPMVKAPSPAGAV